MIAAEDAAPPRLDRHARVPLWSQLMGDLERRLSAGDYAAYFPGEHELSREYRVSRHTVREALRRLRERGLLDSGRGRNTKIRMERIEQSLDALYSLFREVEARGMVQRSEVLALGTVQEPAAAAQLGLPETDPLFHLSRLRLADEQPLAVDNAWLPLDVAAPLLAVDFSHSGLYDELAQRCGICFTGGRESITAVSPSPVERRLLQLPAGVVGLRIERTATLEDRPVEWRSTVLRGDRFAVAAEWSRLSGYRLNIAHSGPDRPATQAPAAGSSAGR